MNCLWSKRQWKGGLWKQINAYRTVLVLQTGVYCVSGTEIISTWQCITDYINFCVNNIKPTKTDVFRNKPWIISDLKALLKLRTSTRRRELSGRGPGNYWIVRRRSWGWDQGRAGRYNEGSWRTTFRKQQRMCGQGWKLAQVSGWRGTILRKAWRKPTS